MEIEIEKKTTEKKEVNIPSYYMAGTTHAFKIISETSCIAVVFSDFADPSIQVAHIGLVFHLDDVVEVGEDDFMLEYSRTQEKIVNIINQ